MTIERIQSSEEIGKLNRLIHDCFFSAEKIVYNKEESTLVIPYKREAVERGEPAGRALFLKKQRVPVIACFLRIHRVRNYILEDTERVGEYDFNEVEYEPGNGSLVITTGIPLKLEAEVEGIDIEVEETDEVIEEKIKRTL